MYSVEDECQAYRNACLKASALPCYETISALENRTATLYGHGDGQVHALLSFLCDGYGAHATALDFSGMALSTSAVSSIGAFIRERNGRVEKLSLGKARLRDEGAAKLLGALLAAGQESRLRELDIRSNRLSRLTAKSLGAALLDEHNGGIGRLRMIDVSNNNMGHYGVSRLHDAIQAQGKEVDLRAEGNLIGVETMNGITHGLGVLFAIIFGTVMVYRASQLLPAYQTFSLAVFSLALCAMFLSSTLYHCFHRLPRAHKIFHTADHCSIFVLIAGSYTPFVTIYAMDPPTVVGVVTLVAIWFCAIVGVLISFNVIRAGRKTRAYFALGMGWSGLLVGRTIYERMSSAVLTLVVAGGVAYSGGIVFYLMGKKRPVLHVIWHLAVMLGGGLHMAAHWVYLSALMKTTAHL